LKLCPRHHQYITSSLHLHGHLLLTWFIHDWLHCKTICYSSIKGFQYNVSNCWFN
jgi:hypothetical protein